MPDPEPNVLTLRMALPNPLSLHELAEAVAGAQKVAPPGAKVHFLMRDIGNQRDPETIVVGLVTTWTPDV